MTLPKRRATLPALLPIMFLAPAFLALALLRTRVMSAPCSEAMIAEVLQPATEKQRAVHLTTVECCTLTINADIARAFIDQ